MIISWTCTLWQTRMRFPRFVHLGLTHQLTCSSSIATPHTVIADAETTFIETKHCMHAALIMILIPHVGFQISKEYSTTRFIHANEIINMAAYSSIRGHQTTTFFGQRDWRLETCGHLLRLSTWLAVRRTPPPLRPLPHVSSHHWWSTSACHVADFYFGTWSASAGSQSGVRSKLLWLFDVELRIT